MGRQKTLTEEERRDNRREVQRLYKEKMKTKKEDKTIVEVVHEEKPASIPNIESTRSLLQP